KAVVKQKMELFNSIGQAAVYRKESIQPWRHEQN
ncbi:MAG: ketose-bisphosphate aldolase, partial [Enterococcus sp.]|nr:ketose-bisphosphate aldolase [Enterococcus sp.]